MIIEELQAHRREIEKLQNELQTFAATAHSNKGPYMILAYSFGISLNDVSI